jgi:hypothetical protein
MIRDPFDGSRGHLTPPPCEGAVRDAQTSRRACPDRPDWAQPRGLIAQLHLLDAPNRIFPCKQRANLSGVDADPYA